MHYNHNGEVMEYSFFKFNDKRYVYINHSSVWLMNKHNIARIMLSDIPPPFRKDFYLHANKESVYNTIDYNEFVSHFYVDPFAAVDSWDDLNVIDKGNLILIEGSLFDQLTREEKEGSIIGFLVANGFIFPSDFYLDKKYFKSYITYNPSFLREMCSSDLFYFRDPGSLEALIPKEKSEELCREVVNGAFNDFSLIGNIFAAYVILNNPTMLKYVNLNEHRRCLEFYLTKYKPIDHIFYRDVKSYSIYRDIVEGFSLEILEKRSSMFIPYNLLGA